MNTVIAKIFGGLGNQLFCYANAKRLAIVNDANLVLDTVSGFKYDFEYQRTYQLNKFNVDAKECTPKQRWEYTPFLNNFGLDSSRLYRKIAEGMNRNKQFGGRAYLKQESLDFDRRMLDLRISGSVYLDGYWQSEKYFLDYTNIIRDDLRITPPNDHTNQQLADRILTCNAVALHVRFFEDESNRTQQNIADNYYEKAISHLSSQFENLTFFVFSDQIDRARRLINLPQDSVVYVNHNCNDNMAYADLWLMTLCDHFIVANSTFSWWGAWLSDRTKKIVIAPDPIRMPVGNFWRTKDLIPVEWNLL
tara:strand:+ start:415 stop:1332 length:918 start_codon:yes stop_codon:yes gene_type:complete